MKYAYVFMILLILLVAAGCSKGEETVGPTAAPAAGGGAAASSQQTAQPSAAASYDLGSDEAAKALDFESSKKTRISTSFKIMQVGEVYVFGVGVKNMMPKGANFKLDVHFREGKTSGGLATLIEEADEDTMLGWIGKNRFSTFSIPGNGEKVVPIIMEVNPQIGQGESTMPGSYAFDVIVNYESSPQFWDPYEENILTIKVKE